MTHEFRLRRSCKVLSRWRQFFLISEGALVLLGGCAIAPDRSDWIKVGQTTRDEVVEAYGEPDLVRTTAEGEIAVYRPHDPNRAAPSLEVPTAQAGPLGTMTTKMEPIKRGLGTRPMNSGFRGKPDRELRIRYDIHGIVQELIQ